MQRYTRMCGFGSSRDRLGFYEEIQILFKAVQFYVLQIIVIIFCTRQHFDKHFVGKYSSQMMIRAMVYTFQCWFSIIILNQALSV